MKIDEWVVKCKCGWEGSPSKLIRGYVLVPPDDVEPMYKCPNCGRSEDTCEWRRRKTKDYSLLFIL